MEEDFKVTYQQLKDFLPNYPDWFERIEKYCLEYEVMSMFNNSYTRSFGEDYPLNSVDPYTVVEMLSDAMYEWDV